MMQSGSKIDGLFTIQKDTTRAAEIELKWTLRDEIGNFDLPMIHGFPDELKGLFSFHPLFHDDKAMPWQDREHKLTRIGGILQSGGFRKCILDCTILSIRGTRHGIVKITLWHRNIFHTISIK